MINPYDKPPYPLDWKIKDKEWELATYIKHYIVDNDISVNDAAKLIKITPPTLKKFILSKTWSHPTTLWKIERWVEKIEKEKKDEANG